MNHSKPIKLSPINMTGAHLEEICCSMPQLKSYISQFLNNAEFSLKPQKDNRSKTSEDHPELFILDFNNQKLEVDFYAKDSYVSSSKVITCRKRTRDDGSDILSGMVTLGLIRKSEKDYHEENWEEMENRRNAPDPRKDQWNNPAFYTKRKEWGWWTGEDSKRYEVTSKGDLIILRKKVIKEFMKSYFSKLKKY